MNPDEIGKAYDQITHLWESNDFNMENGIRQHKKAIQFVKFRGNALEVGCGCTGRILNLLKSEGFNVEGIDVSEKKIQIAKEKFPEILFARADVCQWKPDKNYDFISAWDSIWHVPLEKQHAVLKKLIASLNPKGIMIFSFGGLD